MKRPLSAAVLATLAIGCIDLQPQWKELGDKRGSACIDGMHVRIRLPSNEQQLLPYVVLTQGTDEECDFWLQSNTRIAYLTWAQSFIIKEVQSTDMRVVEDNLYMFKLNDCY